MRQGKRRAPICPRCDFPFTRKETSRGIQRGEVCNKCRNEDKWKPKNMLSKVTCSNCGSLSCPTYNYCIRLGKPKMKTVKITHYAYSMKTQDIYLVSDNEKVFTTNSYNMGKIFCDYPIKDTEAPALISIDDHTQQVGFPLSHLALKNLYPNDVLERIKKYIKDAEGVLNTSESKEIITPEVKSENPLYANSTS